MQRDVNGRDISMCHLSVAILRTILIGLRYTGGTDSTVKCTVTQYKCNNHYVFIRMYVQVNYVITPHHSLLNGKCTNTGGVLKLKLVLFIHLSTNFN